MKKLLVIMGAGSSVEFGMPLVKEVDILLNKWSYRHFSIIDSSKINDNLYNWVKNNFPLSKDDSFNFEETLHIIQIIGSLSSRKDSHLPDIFSLDNKNPFPKIQWASGVEKIADSSDFVKLNALLNQELTNYFRKKSSELTLNFKSEIKQVADFLEYISNYFQLGFINLNYDNVLVSAMPDLNTGFDKATGEFKLKAMYDSAWKFCYHLHGSVHFDMRSDERIFWNEDLGAKFSVGSSNRRSFVTEEGANHPMSTIITGLDKINQIYREPFRQYFFQLDRRIYESDAILFIGYGFNDSYLNKLIRTHAMDTSKRRNIVAIDYQDDDSPSISEGGSRWGHQITSTVYSPYFQMGNGSTNLIYRPDTVREYKNTKTFEFSDNYENPLHVWYSGFLDACHNKEKVLKALKGHFIIPDGSVDNFFDF
ncbi:SIR2 family protein [Maribacter sp. PR1]|uniref:SIR2 family protein n=1 Tax=Maribacter cobaltidurans TaxID=1178778 RepID=A0ABU7IUN1_9FLAO|nr:MULTISPECIES: SIR2 family protein [Maribacter]MDC6389217.1 SIR2 family protein [Maribacter sp. PR1]MEE1976604.1 SIR2 family protein [Maribacter cobaltidurans]